jgi:hypothetical protein
MLRLCLVIVLREPFMRSASLGQGVVLDRRVFASANVFFYHLLKTL